MNQQPYELQNHDQSQSELIELQPNEQNQKTSQQSENLQDLILHNVKQFWSERMKMALNLNNKKSQDKPQSNDIKEIIKVGLELQQYLGEQTEFYHLYTQQIENDFSNIRVQKQQKNFVRKAKLMLEKFIEKYDEVKVYLLFPFNWVKQRVPSFPHIIQNPICIKKIQMKLKLNLYENFESFLGDMDKLFNDFLLFNFQNQQFMQIIVRLRNNWIAIKYEVLQLKNFAFQQFINPSQQFLSQVLDIEEQINLLRQKVTVDKNMSQYLDYDPDYLINDNFNNYSSASNSEQKRKKKTSSQIKGKFQTKKVFESCQSESKTIGKQRILELKKNISKCISSEMTQKDVQKRKFLKYINEKRIQNPNFIGYQNEINLQILGYDEFIELEQRVQKHLNEF